MFFKSYKDFKNSFNQLFKKYHPDNKETGNAELFMKYKSLYDNTIQSGLINKIINNKVIDITTTQAYQGCVVNCDGIDIKISKKFYNKKNRIEIEDKNGVLYKIYVNIIPENDEIIKYDNKYSDLIITKIVEINLFDVILGFEKEIVSLGEKYKIKIKPNELFNSSFYKKIENAGYPQRYNISKRNPLYIKFKVKNVNLGKDDKKIFEVMREKYD